MWQIHEISASYSCFALLSPKFAQILKYFAQSCDCMIAAFRNSAFPYSPLRRSGLYIYIGQKWHRTSFTYCLIKHLIIFSYCSYISYCTYCIYISYCSYWSYISYCNYCSWSVTAGTKWHLSAAATIKILGSLTQVEGVIWDMSTTSSALV